MPAAIVPLVIDQGEDFTAQVIWNDDNGRAQNIVDPIRMDIVAAGNQPIISLSTPVEDIPDGMIPEISYSSEIGLIQIHIPKEQTDWLPPGVYAYDMFVTINDGDAYAGNQQFRLLAGDVVVNQRITVI